MSRCLCPCPRPWWHFLGPLLQEGQSPPATRNAPEGEGGLCALACSVPATPAVPLAALGLRPPGLRGHRLWGHHMANPPSGFATARGCRCGGAISNKMRHSSPAMLGSPQHSLPCRVHRCKVLAVWGDPWNVGSTPVSGSAHRLALPTELARAIMAPPNPLPPQHLACALSGVSLKGLAPPEPRGPIRPPATGGSSPSRSARTAASSRNPTIGHPASAAAPGLPPQQQSPAPPAPGVREPLALAMGAQVFAGGPWGTRAGTCKGPTGCHHLDEQNQPTGSRSHPAPQKHLPPRPRACCPARGTGVPGLPVSV